MLATLVSLALLADPGLYGPARKPAYEVQSVRIEIEGLGDRPLELRVTHPVGAPGQRPVIVFSHGMYGSRDGYGPLARTWAGAGYVVIQPTHGDSARYLTPDQRRELLQRPNTDHVGAWRDRPREVARILDELGEIEAKVPGMKGRLDAARVGVGGHSFGAHTTQMLAGMKVATIGAPEPRAKAFLVISPSPTSPGVTVASLAAMRGPMLMITGTHDGGRGIADGKRRLSAWEALRPGDKWLLWIEGAYHDFGGISGVGGARMPEALRRLTSMGAPNAAHAALVQAASLAFWDATLGRDAAAQHYLATKAIEQAPGAKLSAK